MLSVLMIMCVQWHVPSFEKQIQGSPEQFLATKAQRGIYNMTQPLLQSDGQRLLQGSNKGNVYLQKLFVEVSDV